MAIRPASSSLAEMFLSPEELIDLTGCKRRKDQADWLKAKGYKFDFNKRGRLLVARGHVEHRFGVGQKPAPEPDFSLFRRAA